MGWTTHVRFGTSIDVPWSWKPSWPRVGNNSPFSAKQYFPNTHSPSNRNTFRSYFSPRLVFSLFFLFSLVFAAISRAASTLTDRAVLCRGVCVCVCVCVYSRLAQLLCVCVCLNSIVRHSRVCADHPHHHHRHQHLISSSFSFNSSILHGCSLSFSLISWRNCFINRETHLQSSEDNHILFFLLFNQFAGEFLSNKLTTATSAAPTLSLFIHSQVILYCATGSLCSFAPQHRQFLLWLV